jgi:hypothetical protein
MGGGGELDSGCGEGWRSARAILTVLAQADGDEFQYFFVRVLGYGGVDRANFSRSHSGCMVVSISITGKFGTSKSVRAHASMYHGCIMMAITMYHSCIIDVMEFVPHISVSLHTLPISCFRPSLLGHPVLASAAHASGSWCLGTAMAWQHQTCFLQTGPHACSSMPCWVLSRRNHCLSGIHMGPLSRPNSPCSRPDTLGWCWEPNRAKTDSGEYNQVHKCCISYAYLLNVSVIDNVLILNG